AELQKNPRRSTLPPGIFLPVRRVSSTRSTVGWPRQSSSRGIEPGYGHLVRISGRRRWLGRRRQRIVTARGRYGDGIALLGTLDDVLSRLPIIQRMLAGLLGMRGPGIVCHGTGGYAEYR